MDFFVLGASNLLIHFFALKHMPLADANMIGMGSRVAPDTELAGYPAILFCRISGLAGYPVSGRISG